MSTEEASTTPVRGPAHEALAAFLGRWEAEGTSYGGTDQSGDDPKANGVPWVSTCVGRWHSGWFFLIQEEEARPGGAVFDTISIMGVDDATGDMFARSFENHGYTREYKVAVQGKVWTMTGETERAHVEFSEDARTQTVTWEWKPADAWLPLCDQIAKRTD